MSRAFGPRHSATRHGRHQCSWKSPTSKAGETPALLCRIPNSVLPLGLPAASFQKIHQQQQNRDQQQQKITRFSHHDCRAKILRVPRFGLSWNGNCHHRRMGRWGLELWSCGCFDRSNLEAAARFARDQRWGLWHRRARVAVSGRRRPAAARTHRQAWRRSRADSFAR